MEQERDEARRQVQQLRAALLKAVIRLREHLLPVNDLSPILFVLEFLDGPIEPMLPSAMSEEDRAQLALAGAELLAASLATQRLPVDPEMTLRKPWGEMAGVVDVSAFVREAQDNLLKQHPRDATP